MNTVEDLCEQLKTSVGRFLMDIQSSKYVDYDEYRKIDSISRQLAVLLKPEALIPKAVLHELNVFIKVATAEAPYIGDKEADVQMMVNNIHMTFDLIILGESHEDRITGVIRVL